MGNYSPRAQPADVGSKDLPLHWPVWPPDTEGCGGHGGVLSSEAGVLPAPARAASCGALTPAPTHLVAGCSGYADALGANRQDQSQSPMPLSPLGLTHQQAQARMHPVVPTLLRS